jgi:beta-N-acetylhexosaminidase
MMPRAFITGLTGATLTAEERSFLRDARPWGLILFKRNVETPAQLSALTAAFRDAVGADAPVLVDQEGGRVQRLGPPHWAVYPSAATYGRLYDRDREAGLSAARLGARLIAADLLALGIDVDCLPVADVPVAGASPVISDRAYGDTPAKVASLAGAAAAGLLEGGVLPVVKHLPGHGRAGADSHEFLPVVDATIDVLDQADFAAFRPLAHLPLGMTAHVVFSALDAGAPATTSAVVHRVIRESIGFDGLLMTDDVSMGALSGSIGERTIAAFKAGCDVVLHCNGSLDEMQAVAAEAPVLAGEAGRRAAAALRLRQATGDFDVESVRSRLAALLECDGATGARVAS